MRSSREIAFRLRQEVANLRMWMRPPRLARPAGISIAQKLPEAAAISAKLRETEYAKRVVSLAEEIVAHRFRLLGLVVDLAGTIDWRRDAVHGKSSGLAYFRRIPYLDFEHSGDHKIIWELNRHQHVVILAKAFLFTGREEFLREIESQLTSWWAQNPFLRGINWSSALEVAFRALSWMWTDHLVGTQLGLRDRLMASLYQHGCYLEANLSEYFSPNTHLLVEAVTLEALGILYPDFPQAARWKHTGARILEQELGRQVRADGSHFEKSSYYQVYTLDAFLLHRLLAGSTAALDKQLRSMAEYVEALMGPARRLPLLGDDDGGRMFGLPWGCTFTGRASLATAAVLLGRNSTLGLDPEDLPEQAAWWLGAAILDQPKRAGPQGPSRLFPDAGVAVMRASDVQVLIDGGGFGGGTAGHSHSDTLSLVVSAGDEEILIDAGTYTYVSDRRLRNWFRGSAAHNTIRVDGRDQAVAIDTFCWAAAPAVELLAWTTTEDQDCFDGICRWAGFAHRRRVILLKPQLVLLVLDEIEGPAGEHVWEQFWHFANPPQQVEEMRYRIGRERRMWLSASPGGEAELSEGGEHGWRSIALGHKTPAPVLRIHGRSPLPVRRVTAFGLAPGETAVPEVVFVSSDAAQRGDDSICVQAGEIRVRFSNRGAERIK
jgi:hypothetical protein